MRQRRGISEHISERKPAFRERDARTEGNFYKSFPHERLVYNAVRRTTSPSTALVEGTGVLRTGVLENRRSGKPPFWKPGFQKPLSWEPGFQEARSQKRA